jgi:hypothetical protein
VHTGRSAYNHLLVLAQTHGIPRTRVGQVIDLLGLHDVAGKRAGGFSLGMGQRLGLAAALLGDPKILVLDEPVNGLDPEGIVWMRNLLKYLASQGPTVFVSSHLMSEMALTADHLIVIGRGRLIADCATQEFIDGHSEHTVLVRSPDDAKLREVLIAAGGRVIDGTDGAFTVRGLPAPSIGELAARDGLVLHELASQRASLEEAFMELTRQPRVRHTRTDDCSRRAPCGRACPMSSVAPVAVAAPRPRRPLVFGRALHAEWTKLRTVGSTIWSLVLLVVLTLGFTGLITGVTVSQWSNAGASSRARIIADPTATILGAGFQLSQLTVCVLGVLVIASPTCRTAARRTPRWYRAASAARP